MSRGIPRLLIPLLALFLTGCDDGSPEQEAMLSRSIDDRLGTRFLPPAHFDAPVVARVRVPAEPQFDAIWGATGRDDAGRIYVGVSSKDGPLRTALLYQYDPSTGALRQQSDVMTELREAGLFRSGQGQNKLHSKFVMADDGYLYFSSFDEEGEDARTNPRWGGHLWRKRPNNLHWEHVLWAPQALIAVNSTGRHVYALGYWDHVLYVYDTVTQRTQSVEVGSVPGHISRNFLVDQREHAYVPEVTRDVSGAMRVTLNEYDPDLRLVSSSPLPAYATERMGANQGIVAYAPLRDGRIAFVAGEGELFVLVPGAAGVTDVEHRGKLHPRGGAGVHSLFSFNGGSLICAVSRDPDRRGQWEWVVYELETNIAATQPLNLGFGNSALIYGSVTRDNEGNFYLAGRHIGKGSQANEPLVLQLSVN